MKKSILILFLIMLSLLKGKDMIDNSEVNVYSDKKNNLMWLIDMNNKNSYTLQTIIELENKKFSTERSFENYLNSVNKNSQYKNWRLPTKEELLTLELKNTFWSRIFTKKEKKKTQICIDTDVFIDQQDKYYWTNTLCGDGKYYKIYFNCFRFSHFSIGNSSPCNGVQIDCAKNYGHNAIRVVRDIK